MKPYVTPLRRALRLASGLAIAALFAACEVAVPDDVGAVTCVPRAGACPEGQQCDPATHTCVAAGGVALGDGGEAGLSPPPKGCSNEGCQCSASTDCNSGLCGDATVTSAVSKAAAMTSFCTSPCCTSADCEAPAVCLANGSGENYCVLPQWLGRSPTVGAVLGGASCGGDSDCRSGLCAGGVCTDVCCSTAQSASECASGTSCQFRTFPGRVAADSVFVASCAPAGGSAPTGTSCSSGATCLSGLCAPDRACHDACRNTSDCKDPALECGYAFPGFNVAQIVSVCESSLGTATHAPQGATCQDNYGCQSGFCDAMSKQCTDVCYADADCTPPGWRCRADVTLSFNMHTYSVFACGP